jgi:predicted XRE-type DNA-binding protein
MGSAAKLLGITQPRVSALRNYKEVADLSVERLMTPLTALDQDADRSQSGSPHRPPDGDRLMTSTCRRTF